MERRNSGPRKSFGSRDSGSFDESRGPRRSFGSSGPREFGPREMHKATCADCGNECEVPFQPKEGRPVYCRDCYSKHKKPRF